MTSIVKDIDYKQIEQKWKQRWIDERAFETDPNDKQKCFVTYPFPYINGPPHIGHTFSFVRLDAYARFKRMQGFNTLFPFAFHATGEPILGVAERLEKGDQIQKKILLDDGITENELSRFKDPKYIAHYWQKRWIVDINKSGFSIDWRRSFTTIDPIFNRFIEWQYNLLKKNGYVIQGTHPVVWCPHCLSPTGDHDRLNGEGESPVDYVVIKFKHASGEIFPTATLRPETIYGVTNIWVRPEVEYVRAEVDKEVWIISEPALQKLKDQLHHVKELNRIKGKDLIGKFVKNPINNNDVIILPSTFVDVEMTTGIVMSVPSHAPYDWMALKDLSKAEDKLMNTYRIKLVDLKKIRPVSVIRVEGFGEHPAVEICEKLNIQDQNDVAKLEEATALLYKKEFHLGVLKENCGDYKNLPVNKCKKKLSEDFKKQNIATYMWEPTGKVVCRCGTRNHIKILERQWFLKFSDEKWKKKVRECLSKMKVYPEVARKQFEDVVEWLEDKACARRSGLGTRMPWDKDWIIETLSDSVIYMAFYTIAHHIRQHEIEPDQLKEEVFDFVFFGKGDSEKIAKNTSISKDLLEVMRSEFDYWYGIDIRNSAKELIPNHLTYSIFHHVAVWPNEPKRWPKIFSVNGMQHMNGQKMSKSKGNFITLNDAIEKYSADAIRITLMDANEGIEDPDWTEQATLVWRSKLNSFYYLVDRYYNKGSTAVKRNVDFWLESRIQNHLKEMTQHMEKMENRSAVSKFHLMYNDLQWFVKRTEKWHNDTMNYVLEMMTKVLSIFSPFICEEIWETMGKKDLLSVSPWPKIDDKIIDKNVLQMEDMFKKTCDDIREVVKLSGKNNKLYLYVTLPKEQNYFVEGEEFLRKEFGFKKISVTLSSDPNKYDPEDKAKRAKFGKPGIYVE